MNFAVLLAGLATALAAVHLPFQKVVDQSRSFSPYQKGLLESHHESSPLVVFPADINQVFVAFGSDDQDFRLNIDTRGADTWVRANESYSDDDRKSDYPDYFDPSLSSTFRSDNSSVFHAKPLDLSGYYTYEVEGIFVQDSARVGVNAKLNQVNFALISRAVNLTTGDVGVLGLGPMPEESTALNSSAKSYQYPNFLSQMKAQGFVETKSYSIWLQGSSKEDGSIVFGGVDQAKYAGELQKLPMVAAPANIRLPFERDNERRFVVANSISVTNGINTTLTLAEFSLPALFDTSLDACYLPSEILYAVAENVVSFIYGQYWLPCDTPGGILWNFSGIEVLTPYSELLQSPHVAYRGIPPYFCYLPCYANEASDILWLGNAIMRSLYVVYDYDNQEMGIASAKANVTQERIKDIGADGIPGRKAKYYDRTTVGTSSSLAASGAYNSSLTAHHQHQSKSQSTGTSLPSRTSSETGTPSTHKSKNGAAPRSGLSCLGLAPLLWHLL